jgi:hypothetical protein
MRNPMLIATALLALTATASASEDLALPLPRVIYGPAVPQYVPAPSYLVDQGPSYDAPAGGSVVVYGDTGFYDGGYAPAYYGFPQQRHAGWRGVRVHQGPHHGHGHIHRMGAQHPWSGRLSHRSGHVAGGPAVSARAAAVHRMPAYRGAGAPMRHR